MDNLLKLLSFSVVFLVVGIITLFSLGTLVGLMNGYNEIYAPRGIFVFLRLALVVAVTSGILLVPGTLFLNGKRRMSIFAAAALSVKVCSSEMARKGL